jgi:hypothetical protein
MGYFVAAQHAGTSVTVECVLGPFESSRKMHEFRERRSNIPARGPQTSLSVGVVIAGDLFGSRKQLRWLDAEGLRESAYVGERGFRSPLDAANVVPV